MNTLVITSINPYANVELQLHCFKRWKELGYDIFSYNCKVENLALRSTREEYSDCYRVINDEATGIELFSRPVPRILPLLKQTLISRYEHIILVNSDIYPAHRKPISKFLAESFRTVAFTRVECPGYTVCSAAQQQFYRGGLDTFWFTRSGLQQLLGLISNHPEAERMAFGIPGWDYFLGHYIANSENCAIIDGSLFIHRSHATSYGEISEFSAYAGILASSGSYLASEPTALAHEFQTQIRRQCEDNTGYSKLLKLVFYQQPKVLEENRNQAFISGVLDQVDMLLGGVSVNHALNSVERDMFVGNIAQGNGWPGSGVLASLSGRSRNSQKLLQLLLMALQVQLALKPNFLTTSYPPGNLHHVALDQILKSGDTSNQDENIFHLFAAEMINHGIVNTNLLKFFYSAFTYSDDRLILDLLIRICKKGITHV